MKNLYLFILLLAGTTTLSAQAEIIGTVTDTLGESLPGANVVLLRAKDSLLTSFATTDDKGVFRIQDVPVNDYLMRVTFLGYERPDRELSVSADDQYFDLGNIELYPAGFLIGGVEVTADRIPIRMKGDTMLYDADAFAVGENAVVEDLIRRLPGMSVDASGQITWRGKPINEILINGKPFFAGNSTLLTQNLDAKAINNVEVFDRKTDAEEISGVDDGEENMAVNLEMKEEFKAKVFGELYAGAGPSFASGNANQDPRYQAGGKLFRISDATQIGILSTINNINKVGFSGDEISGFNGASGRGAGFSWRGPEGNLPFDNGTATGENRSIAAGINFGQTIGKGGQLTADYALFDRTQLQTTTTLQSFNRAQDQRVVETLEGTSIGQYSHKVGFEYRQKTDSTGRLTIRGQGYLTGGDSDNQARTFIRNAGEPVDEYTVDGLSTSERPGGSIRLSYNRGGGGGRRFGMPGPRGGPKRTLEVNANASYVENLTDLDVLTAGLQEDGGGIIGSLANGLQNQDRRTTSLSFGGDTRYTEPLGDKWRLRVGAGYNTDRDEGDYRFRLQEQSSVNLLDRTWNTLETGAALIRSIGKGGNLTFGGDYQFANLDLSRDETRTDDYGFFLPFVRFRKRLKKGFLSLNLRSSSQAPSIAQLQTIAEPNANGRVALGNPLLDPATRTAFNGYAFFNDQFRAISANAGGGVNYTDNAFGNSVTFTRGQQIYQTINVGHAWGANVFVGTTIGINAISGEWRLEGRLNGDRGTGFVDNVEQLNTSLTASLSTNVTTELNEDSYLKVGYTFTNFSNSFENADGSAPRGGNADINQVTHDLLAQFELEISPKWRFESRFLYSIFAASSFAEQQTIPDLRLSLEVRPFRKQAHYFRISASDLFNQNTIINRRVSNFVTTEITSNGLGRYFLGTFYYKI